MEHAYFQVSFRPSLTLVSTVRRFTEQFYARMLDDRALSSRVALATHELLENAVAYATDGETSVRVELEADAVAVKTWNRAAPARLADLVERIDRLNAAPDPDAYYRQAIEETARRTDGSGLGLVRVRAEAEMAVTCEVVDDRVCIQARARLDDKDRLAP